MAPKDRIILALDGLNWHDCMPLIRELSPYIGAVKVGFELITAGKAHTIIDFGMYHRMPVFYDGKFHDIPETVSKAVSVLAPKRNVKFLNVHCLGGEDMMRATANAANGGHPKTLGVTVLTSLDIERLHQMNIRFDDVAQAVDYYAGLAEACGLNGVVASPAEAEMIRNSRKKDFLIVTPGVRPNWAVANDHKRFATPKEALARGADYLVIGRPITAPPDGLTSVDAVQKILEEIS